MLAYLKVERFSRRYTLLLFTFTFCFFLFWLTLVFVAAQGLSLAVGEHGLLSVCGARVLTVAASLVVEHRF